MKMVAELEKIDVDAMLVDRSVAYPLIWKAVQCKLQCMAACPPENHAVLQYGHQYGHGVEKAANFEYGHGECVGIGMVATDYLGMLMGLNDSSLLERTTALVGKYGLPTSIGKSVSLEKVWDAMVHDKAFVNGQHRVNFAQPVERNHEFIVIPHELVRQGLSYISSAELMFYNGAAVPKVAFGASGSTTGEQVQQALDAGVRHFDYSAVSSHASVDTLATALSSNILTRDQVTISLSCSTDVATPVKSQCTTMLGALGVAAFDVVKLDVTGDAKDITNPEDVIATWQGMESLVRQSLAKNIGVSNCSALQLEVILSSCAVKPVSLDITCPSTSLALQLAYCEAQNIRLVTIVDDVSTAPPAEVMQFAETLNKSHSQLLLRCFTTRGMGLVLKGEACQDVKNFDLDFTIPSDGMLYTDPDLCSTAMTDCDSDDEESLRGARSCDSLFSLRSNTSMDSLTGLRSKNMSTDSLASLW
jgi:diketogulonate reductase-like aldo/keto reductase